MEHLEFVNELDKLGVSLRGTIREGITKEFDVGDIMGNSDIIQQTDYKLNWKEKHYTSPEPIKALLKYAIDLDTWKHSWHLKIDPENYKSIEEIIQEKIIQRAKEIDGLMAIYFQLHYEIKKIIK